MERAALLIRTDLGAGRWRRESPAAGEGPAGPLSYSRGHHDYTPEQLQDIIARHAAWLRNAAEGSRAHLSWADLSWADLSGANLWGANLWGANLWGAHLSGGQPLGGPPVGGRPVGGLPLGADLESTVMQPSLPTSWQWQQQHGIAMRILTGRTLCPGRRSRRSQHCEDTVYNPGTVYAAPWFSRDTMTACHPGLYVADTGWDVGTDPVLVAYWMDEMVVAGTAGDHKVRVPRFRVVADREAFDALTAEDLEPHKEAP